MREIITEWESPGSPGGLTVMYFNDAQPAGAQREAVAELWENLAINLGASVGYLVRTEGREINEATGGLGDIWQESTPRAGTGQVGTGTIVANATQVVVQWITNSIIGGRRLRGRSYVPGLSSTHVISGELDPTTRVDWTQACQAFVDTGAGFGVWHRPTNGAGGSHVLASVGSVWGELGVQRGRRR